MSKLLYTLIEETQNILSEHFQIIHRQAEFTDIPHMIQVVIGMRRTGKTYFLFQTIRELMRDQAMAQEQILYMNFEDDRLLPMNQKQLGQMIDEFYTLYPANHDRLCYLFFDEIQNVEDWHIVIRRLFDTKKVKIYLTGSSAKLLSKEIASTLRGRSIAKEMWPYSFEEYSLANDIPLITKPFGKKKMDVHLKYLKEYLIIGGFPAVQRLTQEQRRTILQSYIDSVVFRDIVERYKITNTTLIKYLIKTLLKNCASPFSLNKFYNDIKSQGYPAGKDTLYRYLDYIEDAFLAFSVPLLTDSYRRMETNPKKIYAVDTGLVIANLLIGNQNWGPLFENLVYLDLRRAGYKINYYKTQNDYEVDFVITKHDGSMELLQVVWDSSLPEVMERERRALDRAEKELGIPGRLIDPEVYLTASF